ncbi:MAG: hypothetical protein H7A51_19330 [Akkermansiaceae bacterium]|nr:hypothetical protein [Akkermansiaceae bacterium]
MNYCPSCGKGEPPGLIGAAKRLVGFDVSAIVWNREANPGKQYLAGALLSDDCARCGWEVSKKWMHCPWCGLERLVLPFRLCEAIDCIRSQLTDDEDIRLLKTIESHAINNHDENDYSDTVHHVRTFLENWLRYIAECNGIAVGERDGAGKIAYLLKNQLRPDSEELFEYAGYVISIGNEGAHRRRQISEASAVKALESLNLFLERTNDFL